MKIDNGSRIRPSRFDDKHTSRKIGDWLGKATQDDLLATFLWHLEGRYARQFAEEWDDEVEDIKGVLEVIDKVRDQAKSRREWVSVRDELTRFAGSERRFWSALLVEAEAASSQCQEILCLQGLDVGTDLTARYTDAGGGMPVSLLHQLGGTRAKLDEIREKQDAAVGKWNAVFEAVNAVASRRNQFARSANSVSLARIDAMDPSPEFEEQLSSLLERDGFTVQRRHGDANDEGADVIATAPDGRRLVLQAKHRASKAVEKPLLYELNGTAKPVHGADIAGIVTNREFTEPAREFAGRFGIHLIDWRTLQAWATYGEPLLSLIEPAGSVTSDCAANALAC